MALSPADMDFIEARREAAREIALAFGVPPLSPPPALPQRPALFLDMDGVLAPITATPEGVGPDGRRTRVLGRLLERLDGRLAVVSGRTSAEIDRICEGAVPCVAGIHGLERRGADGSAVLVSSSDTWET